MTLAQGSRSALVYVHETTFGTTPASPTMIDIPHNQHTLELTKQSIESQEIRSDRQILNYRHGNRTVAGDIDVELRAADYDKLLESAFFSTVSAGVLKVGTTPQFMTIEDQQLDIAQYRLFKGCSVDKAQVTIKPNAIVNAKFTMVGKDMTVSGSTAASGSITAGAGYQPFDSFTGTINEGGSPIAIVTSIDFIIDNSMKPTFVVGATTTPQMEFGRSRVTGTIQAYFQDAILLNKFVNETSSSIQVQVTDGITGHGYTFLFPKVKYTGLQMPVQNEQSRIITLPFIALYNASDLTQVKLTIA